MSPQNVVHSFTSFDLKQLGTLLSIGAAIVTATAYIVHSLSSTETLTVRLESIERVIDNRLSSLETSFESSVRQSTKRLDNHEQLKEHDGASVRLAILEHRMSRIEEELVVFSEKLDTILERLSKRPK